MDTIYLKINDILNLFMPSSFTLFERLVIFGLFFGIFVWLISQFKK